MTTIAVPNTPVVQNALEHARQRLDDDTSPGSLAVALGFTGSEPNSPEHTAAIAAFKARCRELGALDQICAERGITEAVMERELGR